VQKCYLGAAVWPAGTKLNSEKVKRDHRLVMNRTAVYMAGRFWAARYAIGGLCPEWLNPQSSHCSSALVLGTIYMRTNTTHRTGTAMYVGVTVCKWVATAIWYNSTLLVGTKHVCSTWQLCWYMPNSSPLCALVDVEWITSGITFIYIYKSISSHRKYNSIRFDQSQNFFNFDHHLRVL